MLRYELTTPVLIYGAGGDGRRAAETLDKNGGHIVAFLDRRAGELTAFAGHPVRAAEEGARLAPGALVVVALKNVFAHDEVARMLRRLGFEHIIFRPRSTLEGGGTADERRLAALQERLTAQCLPLETGTEIPSVSVATLPELQDRLRIVERESRIITWVPAELVFNYADEEAAFARCNMPLFFPLVGMFRGFLDSESTPDWREDFLAYSGDWLAKNDLALTEGQRLSMLESRAAVFQEMQRTFELDFDFFRRSAPPAVMSAPGRFELTASGRNRMAFLLAKGFRLLPLAVEREAYEAWAAPDALESLRRCLASLPSGTLPVPVPHPLCAMLPARFTDYARLFLLRAGERLMRSLCARHAYVDGNGLRRFDHARVRAALAAMRVVSLLRDGGLAARYFASLDCRAAALFDSAWPEQEELSACLDGLYARLSDDARDSGRVDILLLDAAADADIAGSLLERAYAVCLLQDGTEVLPAGLATFEEQLPLFRSRTSVGDIAGRLFVRRS